MHLTARELSVRSEAVWVLKGWQDLESCLSRFIHAFRSVTIFLGIQGQRLGSVALVF